MPGRRGKPAGPAGSGPPSYAGALPGLHAVAVPGAPIGRNGASPCHGGNTSERSSGGRAATNRPARRTTRTGVTRRLVRGLQPRTGAVAKLSAWGGGQYRGRWRPSTGRGGCVGRERQRPARGRTRVRNLPDSGSGGRAWSTSKLPPSLLRPRFPHSLCRGALPQRRWRVSKLPRSCRRCAFGRRLCGSLPAPRRRSTRRGGRGLRHHRCRRARLCPAAHIHEARRPTAGDAGRRSSLVLQGVGGDTARLPRDAGQTHGVGSRGHPFREFR